MALLQVLLGRALAVRRHLLQVAFLPGPPRRPLGALCVQPALLSGCTAAAGTSGLEVVCPHRGLRCGFPIAHKRAIIIVLALACGPRSALASVGPCLGPGPRLGAGLGL